MSDALHHSPLDARHRALGARMVLLQPAPPLRERYFTADREGWRVAPKLHSRIRWSVANLMVEAEVAWLATASVIFCRNVFIYFSQDSIRKTVTLFSRLMPRPGYLFVGASESLLRLTTDFDFQEIGGAFVYVKI